MTPLTIDAINSFAQYANKVLADEHTPPRLATCVKYCVSEVREMLPAAEKRRIDGLEAEAVLTAFASLHLEDEGCPQTARQTSDAPPAISVGTSE